MARGRDLFRELPAIDRLLAHAGTEPFVVRFRRDFVVRHCREIVEDVRHAIECGEPLDPAAFSEAALVERLKERLERARDAGLTRVVNATGTVLHTNLGRAPLADAAVEAVRRAASSPVDLEYDLGRGGRGRREARVEALLAALTGAEAATAVNNNAAAVLLALNTLAAGREVIVSRGELIEIGGAFRIPEIMAKSGALLREVGTTNRTHAADYEAAIGDRTGLLLKVHTSNYKVIGFVADVPLPDLVAMGRARGIPVMEDLGSGALVDLGRYALPREPVVADRVALGPDVVTFSGDKVLGGPQAGLIAGTRRWLADITTNPLHRALRCGKLTIAALEATLKVYDQAPDPAAEIPTLSILTRPVSELEEVGSRALRLLEEALGSEYRLSLANAAAQIGSGALPTDEIPSKAIVVRHARLSAHRLAERFRAGRPPILGRVANDSFLLDLRAIFDPADLVPHWAA